MSRVYQFAFRALVSLAIIFACGWSAYAESIVDFGGNYVPFSTSVSLRREVTYPATHVALVPFSDTEPLNPYPFEQYSGTSDVFYGGHRIDSFSNTVPLWMNREVVDTGGPIDGIYMQTNILRGPAAGGQFFGLFLWRKQDFLSGGSSSEVALDSSSEVLVDGLFLGGPTGRIVASDSSGIYVSESIIPAGASPITLSLNGNWAPYDPVADLQFTGTSFSPHVFDDVHDIGIYYSSPIRPDGGNGIIITRFVANATIVPEAQTLIVALIALLALLTASRKPRAIEASLH